MTHEERDARGAQEWPPGRQRGWNQPVGNRSWSTKDADDHQY